MSDIPSIADAARRIAAKELSPVELTQACLDRIAAVDEQLHSYVLVLADEALATAREAEAAIMRGEHRGPLHGIPIALKDIYETAGVRTTGQSKLRQDHVPETDATTTARLKQAGMVLTGKLTTHEFAFGGPSFDLPQPPARNPWDTSRFTGGSSSGSAAAVAAGLCLGALGSDTGGSIRVPAAFCGIAGIKPTYGRVSRAGVFPLVYSMDHCGPMAWTVEDCAIMLSAIAGHDPRDETSAKLPVPDYAASLDRGIEGLRVGVVRHFYEDDDATSPAVTATMNAAAAELEALGAHVEDARLSSLDAYHASAIVTIVAEAFALYQDDLQSRPHDFGEMFRHRVMLGALVGAADYVQATRRRRQLTLEMDRALEKYDVLVTASIFGLAPPIEGFPKFYLIEKPLLSTPANVTGLPALSLCNGFSEDGLPLSMQIIGRRFDEETVLRVGAAYEKATPWRDRRPEV